MSVFSRKIGRLVAVRAPVGVSAYAARVLADGAVAHWRLGDDIGASSAADASAGNHPGTPTGVTFGQPGALGEFNTAALFAGTSRITMGDVAAFEFQTAFSVEFWAKYTAVQALAAIIGKMSAAINSGWAVFEFSGTGFIQFYAVTEAGALMWDFHSPLAYNDGLYHHVVCTWDGTTDANGVTINVDGLRVSATVALDGPPGTSVTPFALGSFGALSSGFFAGTLDEVALYPSALSIATIQAHYALRTTLGPNPRKYQLRPARITAVGSGTNVTCKVLHANGETYTDLPRWSRLTPNTPGWVRT